MCILRKGLLGFLLDQLLVVFDDGLEIGGGEVGIHLDLGFGLARVEDVIELFHVDIQRDFAEHLNEAAVGIVGEARIAGDRRQAFSGGVIQAEVQNRIHHAGHGEARAGADADQQRILGIAKLLADLLFELRQRREHLLVDLGGHAVLILEIDVADFGGNGEAGRHGHSRAAHFREACALAAEDIFHLAVAVGCAAAKAINVVLHDFICGLLR